MTTKPVSAHPFRHGLNQATPTRQHFEAIALIISNSTRTIDVGGGKTRVLVRPSILSLRLAKYFETTNENFDRTRFLAACRV